MVQTMLTTMPAISDDGRAHIKQHDGEKARREPDQRRRPQQARDQHHDDADQAAQQIEAVGPQILAVFHQPAAQLTDRDERHGGEQKDDRQQQEQNDAATQSPCSQPHGQLLAERIHAQVDRHDADEQDEAELRRQ